MNAVHVSKVLARSRLSAHGVTAAHDHGRSRSYSLRTTR